jgi:hypothetical protein
MQSTSASDGTYTLTVTFAIGTDADQAQVLVQNLDAVDLLLDRQRDGVDDGPGAGAGIAGGHLHGRRDHPSQR